MSFKPIYVDRSQNSEAKVGGVFVYLCDTDSDVDSLPKGLPDEVGTASPLPGSVALVTDPKGTYVLNNQNEWIKWG